MPVETSPKFVFNNLAEDIYPLVQEILEYIQQCSVVKENTLLKVKPVLIELLTNSVKHCGDEQSIIEIEAADGNLTIRKTDTGYTPIIATQEGKLAWPLPGIHHFGRVVNIYGDDACMLKVRLHSNCHAEFFTEGQDESETGLENIPEHFGLMIISRASKSFTYNFDIATCTNIFTANIAL